jgi:hypothetical protein
MKKYLILAAAVSFGTLAHAQSIPKNDPGYSINNYKHPNKAREARKVQNTDQKVVGTYRQIDEKHQPTNYKAQNQPAHLENNVLLAAPGGNIERGVLNPLQATGHYKTQGPKLVPKVTTEALAVKPKKNKEETVTDNTASN